MSTASTEALHNLAAGIDTRAPQDVAAILADGQIAAARSVQQAIPQITDGASAMARTLRKGGVLHYLAAGSSGLMAAADAQELGGTFSIPHEQLRIHMAGGLPTGVAMPGGTEDDTRGLAQAFITLTPDDTVIAVSASGSTPYTLEGARLAKAAGASVVAIANSAGAPLLALADHPIFLETPPEIVSGSTRLGAGTAQKIALNMLSTLMAVSLGHVHDGMMVNLRADNHKLRARARAIVCEISHADPGAASAALDQTDGEVKPAILIAAHGLTAAQAYAVLRETGGNLRAALAHQSPEGCL